MAFPALDNEKEYMLGFVETKQANLLKVGKGDLLIGVTAMAETTAILGTALHASEQGAEVQMVVCSNPVSVSARLERARRVFERDNV